jgi:hypothetical protein
MKWFKGQRRRTNVQIGDGSGGGVRPETSQGSRIVLCRQSGRHQSEQRKGEDETEREERERERREGEEVREDEEKEEVPDNDGIGMKQQHRPDPHKPEDQPTIFSLASTKKFRPSWSLKVDLQI